MLILHHVPPGLPPDNATVLCPDGGESCYFWYHTSLSWERARAACKQNRGAFLVSYNSADEQLMVESYYRSTGRLFWYYWIGLEKSGNVFYWWVVLASVASVCF
jgi:hypothetical protein